MTKQKAEEKWTISLAFVNQYLGFEEINWVSKTKVQENTMIKNLVSPHPTQNTTLSFQTTQTGNSEKNRVKEG